jgi:hypothetical protein
MARTWVVKIHFNQVNMQRGNPKVWTIHFRGVCHQVKGFRSEIDLYSVYNPTGPQPRATLRGWAERITVDRDGYGHVYK